MLQFLDSSGEAFGESPLEPGLSRRLHRAMDEARHKRRLIGGALGRKFLQKVIDHLEQSS